MELGPPASAWESCSLRPRLRIHRASIAGTHKHSSDARPSLVFAATEYLAPAALVSQALLSSARPLLKHPLVQELVPAFLLKNVPALSVLAWRIEPHRYIFTATRHAPPYLILYLSHPDTRLLTPALAPARSTTTTTTTTTPSQNPSVAHPTCLVGSTSPT
ncbi:hypothetical protein PMIN04_009583 [Paraphaeosphaeria minitans]